MAGFPENGLLMRHFQTSRSGADYLDSSKAKAAGEAFGAFSDSYGFRRYRESVWKEIDALCSPTWRTFDSFPRAQNGFAVKPFVLPSPMAASRSFSLASLELSSLPSSSLASDLARTASSFNIASVKERIRVGLSRIPAVPTYDRLKEDRQKESMEVVALRAKVAEAKTVRSLPALPPNVGELLAEARKLPPNQTIREIGNIPVTPNEFRRLAGTAWLNDEIINAYLSMVQERADGRSGVLPSIHVFNTHFFSSLQDRGYEAVQRWTRRIDLFSKDLVFVPVHLGAHWVLTAIDMRARRVRYLDSLHGRNWEALRLFRMYLEREHQDKKGFPLDCSSWLFECDASCPRQQNGYDCGVFTCVFAEHLSRGWPLSLSQRDMPYFRDRIGYELLQGALLPM